MTCLTKTETDDHRSDRRNALWPQSSVFPDEPYHLIQLGLVEQSRRELQAASLIAKLAVGVAIVSLLVALIVALVQ